MKVDEMLKLARACMQSTPNESSVTDRLARAIVQLLDRTTPCGWDDAYAVDRFSTVCVPEQWRGDVLPGEARAIAVSLLRAADAAEGQTKLRKESL